MKKTAGFTLIELLVVIVIISIVVTSALLSMRSFMQDRRAVTAAKELNAIIPVAQQQAMLQPAVLGLKIAPNKYEFYRFIINTAHNTGTWQLITRDRILNSKNLPASIKFTLITQASESLTATGQQQAPQIIFFPSGDMTPFTIKIGKYVISGKANGSTNLSK